jgi:rhodanese-related sulfurtransferase
MPEQIALKDVLRLMDDGAQVLDVLSRKEYEASHLPDAVSIPLTELDEVTTAVLDRERPVVAYCFDYE